MKNKHSAFNLSGIRHIYPFQSHYLSIPHRIGDGFRNSLIHFVDEGAKGTPILFLHGNPTWSFAFRNLIIGLRGEHRCIAPDHLGCGLSERPQGVVHRLADRSHLILQLLDALKIDKVSLFTHDWGGAIGMKFAVDHPDRIERIVLTNTAAFPSENISWRINLCRQPIIGRCINQHFNGFLGAALFMATTRRLTADVKQGYLLPYRRNRDRLAIHQFVRDIPMHPEHPSYPALASIPENLDKLRDKPTCVIWGMQDFCFTPFFLERWRELIPHASFHELPDAGHFLFEDAGPECLSILQSFFVDPASKA